MRKAILLLCLVVMAGCIRQSEVINMPAQFQIIKPEATINLITSPSVEGDVIYFPIPPYGAGSVLGWEAVGSTLAQVIEPARFGTASLEVVTNGAAAGEGTYFRVDPNTLDTNYTGSVYVRGTGRVRARLVDSMGDQFLSDEIQLRNDRWLRITDVLGKTGPVVSNDLRLYIETVGVQAITFFVDGAQIEQKTYTTTYCDGDQDGCTWNVISHASTSDRSSQERSGGQLINLDEESLGVYITMTGGIGVPPLRLNLLGRALLPGMEYQSTKILPRTITLTFWSKMKNGNPGDLRPLHQKRQALIDLVKSDVVSPTQPFILRYNGGNVPLDVECLYEAGLEFEGDMRNPYFNSFMMRMICPDVFWNEDNQEAVELGLQKSLGQIDGILQRVDGDWQDWGGTLAGLIENAEAVVKAPDGRIYIGGRFNNAGGVVCNSVAYWDGENWNSLNSAAFGPGLDNTVHAAAVDYNGIVYFGGVFTDVFGGPGGTYNRIVSWNPVTETFAALGPGLNGSVISIDIAPDGMIYVVGGFNDVQGGIGNSLNHIAQWNPFNLTWNAMGAGPGVDGVAPDAVSIKVNQQNTTIYVGGQFDREFGGAPNTLLRIASYDIATDTFTELGGGANGNVDGLDLARNGDLFIAGAFTTIGGVNANYAAVWNGSGYSALGSGFDAASYRVTITSDGLAWYGGGFGQAGGRAVDGGFVAWNGSVWIRPPVNLPNIAGAGNPSIGKITDSEGILFIGGNFDGTWWLQDAFVAVVTEVDNIGSSDVQPIIEILGPGNLTWIENITTGNIMYMEYTLQPDEILTIDFRTGKRTVTSSWAGEVLDAVLPQSSFSAFHLQPGINRISLFMDDILYESWAQIRYVPQHESADGTVR